MKSRQGTSQPLQYLPFEEEVARIDQLIAQQGNEDSLHGKNASKIRQLQVRQTELLQKIYSNLSPWQTVQVARHPRRPILNDYLSLMFKDVHPLHGDRCFGDDKAITTALGQIGRHKVMIVGQNKGRDIKEKIACNFGCPNPEGYRKALLKMKFAEKFGLPIVTLIDTPGAYPGIGAEERGQAQAIAVNLMEMSRLRVPIVCIVIGEGGSGGALGIGVGDRLAMLEFAYYSVISPEGCAAILWHDGTQAPRAADALKLTAKELMQLGVIDAVIPEPLGGAHRNQHDTIYNVEQYIVRTLHQLKRKSIDELLEARYRKLRSIGEKCLNLAEIQPQIPERLSAKVQIEKAVQEAAEAKIEVQ
ncbi:MAG TPA: acetyl-CoA carboxylase carboxyltransferase subunit alpha [Anaerohalosphaeraceae bacterium]|jgi:acetyl-CoA carboxylase carboxyl transferase subunit alpha|nr:acetyl-CoA carboxylase carboxyltransferase subunit alpha [Anaerohalosphaeraceae bacterium]HQG06450.1 acetyl-CoA carboxylase carboxyltransferase subunit alpha [Anaerohalosphaeraceae bacterium]HQI07939.1 acetyl-CoA carboxylase carboxyltransferase subunit alpha [Anaerohalosphaeraceae bacterium]HQJ68161.1 acetyl-CoA carboxylase carboxyltransferase subunit alpha [Anaerohalosphaeraceae bacterium]